MQIYLDNAATTRVCPEAAQAALSVMTEVYGNPSSTHSMGRQAARLLEAAREQVSQALGAASDEVFFTSGGTESINWAILSGAERQKRHGKHIVSSMAEHSAVLRCLDILEKRGYEVTRLRPQKDGSVALTDVLAALRVDTALVSLVLVNNETGGITDIEAISKEIKRLSPYALLHTDAVQGFLKLPFSAKTLGTDMISITGHKIHAPKGVGALYIKGGAKGINLAPAIVGGLQEGGKRAGTEALPLIAAFGASAELGKAGLEQNTCHMLKLKELSMSRLSAEIPNLRVLGSAAPHILSVSLPGHRSEVLMNYLEGRGIFVSKSSACKKGGRSHVLEAAGHPPAAIDGALRISFSRYTTESEVEELCNALKRASEELCTR